MVSQLSQVTQSTSFLSTNRAVLGSNPAALSTPAGASPWPVYRKAEWHRLLMRLKAQLRPWILRYGKFTEDQIINLVKKTMGQDDVDSDEILFNKALIKVHTNQSTWKHRTLRAMQISKHKHEIEAFCIVRLNLIIYLILVVRYPHVEKCQQRCRCKRHSRS